MTHLWQDKLNCAPAFKSPFHSTWAAASLVKKKGKRTMHRRRTRGVRGGHRPPPPPPPPHTHTHTHTFSALKVGVVMYLIIIS